MFLVANVKEPSVQNLQRITTSSSNFNETMSQHIFTAMKSSWYKGWWGWLGRAYVCKESTGERVNTKVALISIEVFVYCFYMI